MDMSIDGKGRVAKSLRHHDRGGFVSDTGQLFQVLEGGGDFAVVFIEENARQPGDGFCFLRRQSAGTNDFADGVDGMPCHFLRIGSDIKKRWCDLIHTFVRALGGEQNRDQESERITVVEWDGWLGVKLRQFGVDEGRALCLRHDRDRMRLKKCGPGGITPLCLRWLGPSCGRAGISSAVS